MTPEQIQNLIDLIKEIGGALAENGFAIAYKRAIYVGVSNLAVSILLIITGTLLARLAINCWKKFKDDMYSIFDFYAVSSSIVALTAFVIALCSIWEGLDNLFNPEWAAVQMLLGLIH